MSSTRSNSLADYTSRCLDQLGVPKYHGALQPFRLTSMAVFKVWILTAADSNRPYSLMSTTLPVSPSTPKWFSPFACLACETIAGDQESIPTSDNHRDTHPQLGQHPDGVTSTVLYQSPGNDLERVRHGPERRSRDTFHRLTLLGERDADRHLGRSTPGCKGGVENDVPCDGHGVGQVSVNLVQDVLGRSSEEDRTSLGGLAFGQKGKVPVKPG